MSAGVVIVGAGQAGLQAALSLREGGFAGPVTLIGNESYAPYQRPPLSKTFLADSAAPESLYFKSRDALTKRDIQFLDTAEVVGLDRTSKSVTLSDGAAVPYDKLILATGTRNRPLPVPGADAAKVFMLRGVDDALALRRSLDHAGKVAIIGGGFIGLEVAASFRKRDTDVVLIEAGSRLCARACTAETSAALLSHQRNLGTDLRLNAQVAGIATKFGNASGVCLADGSQIDADLVLVCIGVIPNEDIARHAGLSCDNGIKVDATLRSSDPSIFAIGDCARFPCPDHGSEVRLESVPNATAQGRHVANTVLGQDAPFRALPWFWSDQGDMKLQMAGITAQPGTDATVDVVTKGNGQVAFCFAGGLLRGVECLNAPVDFVTARKMLTDGYTTTRDDLIGAGWDLRALAKARAA